MPDYIFTIFSGIGSLLCILTGYVNYKSKEGPLATLILTFWIFAINFLSFLDSIIWTNDPQQWWDGKIYCDINSRIKSTAPIGVPGAAIGVFRFLADTTIQHTSQQGGRNRFKSNVIDLLLGLLLPGINAGLKYFVAPNRYIIDGVNGCNGSTDYSWPGIFLYRLWPPVFSVVTTVYAGIASDLFC